MKPFSDGELVKDCIQVIEKEILPNKSNIYSSISLSRDKH